jgi:hypothetical protein
MLFTILVEKKGFDIGRKYPQKQLGDFKVGSI